MAKHLDSDWENRLKHFFASPQMQSLRAFLKLEKAQNKEIFPPTELTFNALNLTPFEKVKVVILGQDPYHGKGQAHGLCFSVPSSVNAPPSLQNIFKELYEDLGVKRTNSDLSDWAQQGVLLLNSVLTVEAKSPASHADKGWEHLTDGIIQMISSQKVDCAFLLWGAEARKKRELIKGDRHYVYESTHPSPYSADKGDLPFFGSKPFSHVNSFLVSNNKEAIKWG